MSWADSGPFAEGYGRGVLSAEAENQASGPLPPVVENILPLVKRPFLFAKLISNRNYSILWALIQAQELDVRPGFELGDGL
jgi:hypothetical protein